MAMTQTEFVEKLAAKGDSALFGGITKYQHVERLGSENVEGLLDGFPLVVQEKIDGANLTVALDKERGLVICSRNAALSIGGEPATGFRGAVEYVLAHCGIAALLALHPTWILRGEWLVKHTVVYSADAWNKFYVFDVQDSETGQYIPLCEYAPMLETFGVLMVPHIATVQGLPGEPTCSLEWLIARAKEASPLGAAQREGVVVKRYGYVNQFGRTQWGKVVNADFQEAHKTMQCTDKDPAEIRFVARCVTEEFVRKLIGKIEDRKGGLFETRDIPELIGRAWYEAFTEEMWDFVKSERVSAFNFREAQRLCTGKARDVALAYASGSM